MDAGHHARSARRGRRTASSSPSRSAASSRRSTSRPTSASPRATFWSSSTIRSSAPTSSTSKPRVKLDRGEPRALDAAAVARLRHPGRQRPGGRAAGDARSAHRAAPGRHRPEGAEGALRGRRRHSADRSRPVPAAGHGRRDLPGPQSMKVDFTVPEQMAAKSSSARRCAFGVSRERSALMPGASPASIRASTRRRGWSRCRPSSSDNKERVDRARPVPARAHRPARRSRTS